MKAVAFETAIPGGERFIQLDPAPKCQRRLAPGHRHAGTGHHREFEILRLAVHPLGILPGIREMLIAINRHAAPRRPEDFDDLLEQPPAGIEFLALGILRVVPMLADEEHGIRRQLFAAQA